MAMPNIIYLRECLDYDPGTGEFRWRARPESHFRRNEAESWNRRYVGKLAGGCRKDGYRWININQTKHYAHRIAWLLTYGDPAPSEIDHIDGDPSNNRLSNLRAASHQNNKLNSKVHRDSRTGIKGVYPLGSKFVVEVGFNGKHRHIGTFDTLEKAATARRQAAERMHGEFARHSVRESYDGNES